MTYRVTNSMMQTLMLNDMQRNLNKILDAQQQLSTQRKYQNASDNPSAVTKGMGLETMLVEGEQYISNLKDAISWLKFTDSAMNDMSDLFTRIRELAIYAGDGGLEKADLEAIAKELQEAKKTLLSYANGTIGGEYLFAGLKTGDVPFTVDASGNVVYNGNNYAHYWEIARGETGKVSVTGREVFPQNETTYSLNGIEVPIDFEWKGRSEILEFKVGFQTVKVRIPERWTDEIVDNDADAGDYNRFRDPGEYLDGYTLDEIAALINKSTEMGDVSKLLKATVVKDLDKGVQYLKIESHTGEAVRMTSWPETDPEAVAQGIKGAAYGPLNRTAVSDGAVEIRFGDNDVFTVDVEAGESLKDIAEKLNAQPDGRLWAAYRTDGTNEWLDVVARNPDDVFKMETTGGAVALFAPQLAEGSSKQVQGDQVWTSNTFDTPAGFSTLSDGTLAFTVGNETYRVNVPASSSLAGMQALIEGITDSGGVQLFNVDITGGNLKITAANPNNAFDILATGGTLPLLSNGVSASSTTRPDEDGNYTLTTSWMPDGFAVNSAQSGLSLEYDGKKYWIPLAVGDTMQDVADKISALGITPPLTATVESDTDQDGNVTQRLVVVADKEIKLSGFGDGAAVVGAHVQGTEDIYKNPDISHIGFAEFMGVDTAIRSTEVPVGSSIGNTDIASGGTPLHIKIVSGKRTAEIFIGNDPNLTLEELAKKINSVCGEWFEAIVETDEGDGTSPNDPLNNSGQNREGATQRLVLRTKDGQPFTIYDGPGEMRDDGTGSYIPTGSGDYASTILGINTALTSVGGGTTVTYPSDGAGSFDENMPARLNVTVGNRTYEVKICPNKQSAESVFQSIVEQVNEQYGGTLLAFDANDIVHGTADRSTAVLYAVTGEPLRVTDIGYGIPTYGGYTGGVAAQLGIAAGITSPVALDTDRAAANGSIRIATPGRTVDVPVLAGDTLQTIAERIKDYAGEWVDVSFYDSNIDQAGGNVQLSIAAKDGSALSVYDLDGSAAADFGISTGLVSANAIASNWKPVAGDTMTVNVNGVEHTIDLWDTVNGQPVVYGPEELADMINTRFQGQDVKAEVITRPNGDKHLVLTSPKGYNVTVSGAPAALGINGSSASPNANAQYNQVVTNRTGNDKKATDIFGVIDNLIKTVEGGFVDGISDTLLGQLDNWQTNLLKCRAQVGALVNRYDTAVYRTTSNNTNYTELHTETVGVDLAKAYTDYEMASSVYTASLAAISRLMQASLLDFLR